MFKTVAGYGNALLDALRTADLDCLSPHLERVELLDRQLVHTPGVAHHHVYFPIDCIVSLQVLLGDGASNEIALVGHEGASGVGLIMGSDRMAWRASVHSAGSAWRVDVQCLREECLRSSPLQLVLLRYSQTLMMQVAQIAICNRHHTVGQQFCRWLLMMLDRLASNELSLTHERIANLLGVRREGVTEVACALQRVGVIRYRRGHIEVLDRNELEAHACECYRVIQVDCRGFAAAAAADYRSPGAALQQPQRKLPSTTHVGWGPPLGVYRR